MKIGTAEPNSTFLTQGLALAAVFEQAGLGPVETLEARSASIENAESLAKGQIDYGFMAANWIGRAMRGEAPFTQPTQLRMVSPMNLGPMFFIAPADGDLRTVEQLRGKRVSVGPATSGTAQHGRCIFGALGLSFDDFTPLYMDFASGAEALRRGEIDAQLQCPIPNRVMTALDADFDLRVLGFEPGGLEKVLAAYPVYGCAIMRKGQLRGLQGDSPQSGVRNVLVTHARQSADEVEAVVRAIVGGAQELERANALFTGLGSLWEPLRAKGEAALSFEGVPLHEGARRAYKGLGFIA
jgi:TRAP transporter TAXI family solute receptor